MIKVKDNNSLSRDPRTKAIINNDNNAFEKARLAKRKSIEQLNKIENIENEVENIKKTMNEILNILKKGEK